MIDSPCTGVCELAKDSMECAGCHRTLAEISHWLHLSEQEKLLVLASARERKNKRKDNRPLLNPSNL